MRSLKFEPRKTDRHRPVRPCRCPVSVSIIHHPYERESGAPRSSPSLLCTKCTRIARCHFNFAGGSRSPVLHRRCWLARSRSRSRSRSPAERHRLLLEVLERDAAEEGGHRVARGQVHAELAVQTQREVGLQQLQAVGGPLHEARRRGRTQQGAAERARGGRKGARGQRV
jgi:hypothetical protein